MFNFDIIMSNKSDFNKLYFRLPLLFYIQFFIIVCVILGSIIFSGPSLLSIILLIVSVLIVTFQESWFFDKNSGKIYSKVGFGFIYKKIIYEFNDLESIEITSFIKGKRDLTNEKKNVFNKKYYSLKLNIIDGKTITLLTCSESKKELIDLYSNEIINITNKKLIK